MLPSLLVRDIQKGLKQFLQTGFEPSDTFFNGLISRFVAIEKDWMKGPYLQIGLPFRAGREGRNFFGSFQTEYKGHVHQEMAWQRLSSNRLAANSLIATGTGSGKTECFLYPLLEHAARARKNGESGIKALVIYPMNALATDQARRFAEVIAQTPAFAGLRVGLYVGGQIGNSGSGMVMSASGVITDRQTLRKAPPDILLTNYKMLDYLLIRPLDRVLWAKNKPETLRYIVVDELHTFDGAQGTDLALLLRRLRARLKTPKGHLLCAGTSATLGNASDTAPLRNYAKQIFQADFPAESVITENRLTVSEFLGNLTIEHFLYPRADLIEVLRPDIYTTSAQAVKSWFHLFFPEQPEPLDVNSVEWRQTLGKNLKQHVLFVNLLRLSSSGVTTLEELQSQLRGPIPESARPFISEILDALLVLVAWARNPESQHLPLVTVRLQLWLRELRRMVAKVTSKSEDVHFKAAADLKSKVDGLYLPLIQCTECHTTAWLSHVPKGRSRVSSNLEEIYNAWFARQSEVVRLYPGDISANPQVEGLLAKLCSNCGQLQGRGDECSACGHDEMVTVFRTTGTKNTQRGNLAFSWHDNTCPSCSSKDKQLLLGARNATLGAQVVEHSWSSIFNDDKKMIAFSDSVQDAAHRAGFFGARTWVNTVRTAMAKAIDDMGEEVIPWKDFLYRFGEVWTDKSSALCMDSEATFVSEFIGPNMLWQRDWADELLKNGALPLNSRLPLRVKKRLCWQAYAEFTYLNRRGRNLERIGKAVLAPDYKVIESISDKMGRILQEEFGGHHVDNQIVFQWLWGFLIQLRRRGAVWHPELEGYATDGNIWGLAFRQGRSEWMPAIGERTPHPVFITLGNHRNFDRLTNSTRQSWYVRWLNMVLGKQMLLAAKVEEPIYHRCIDLLVTNNLLVKTESTMGFSIALADDGLNLYTHVSFMKTGDGKRQLSVPAIVADQLIGMPCLDAPAFQYETVHKPEGWLAKKFSYGDLKRVIAAEHTGLLERGDREQLETRFKSRQPQPWFENLLSATPTLEMGVDIGDLSSVLLCSVPPSQASFLQRIGRAGRRDGNALATTLADGNSPHDLYFFAETNEMLAGEVSPPGVFLQAVEVLRRQLLAYCLDDWVASDIPDNALPEKTSQVLDAIEKFDNSRFPYTFLNHMAAYESRLQEGFIDMLGEDITPVIADRLRDYYQGKGDSDGLRVRLLKHLEELKDERSHYRTKADVLKNRIKTLKASPQDEASINEVEKLDRERQGALELVREINQRELLNSLTDAGLIPNYAFPEAGIELKSVLWRKKGSDDTGDSGYVALPAIKYERPAGSALSEFAPENRFYANQRRVEVDQINMALAKLEPWRLCPSCHHMENLILKADTKSACPRCGDVMWSNVSQLRHLLRFKQAIANSDDTKVRIDDSADDREPRYYTRQLLADFEGSEIKEAWKLAANDLPFGFEFIASANFRDINFGEIGKSGDVFKVADKEVARPGFKLCRHCGKVQSPLRREQEETQQHAFDCPKRDNHEPSNIIDCLYLYREFSSEALRILVPYTRSGVDDEVVQSFMAALQLGLKKRFGGKVDHLRLVTQDEPGRDGGPRRQYVLLYDSVPGGTGYLHQLLSLDAQTLIDVFRMAYQAVLDCKCNQDPDKDGCYSCVYQYRLGKMMSLVSRNKAKEVFGELLEAIHTLEKVPTISEIYINPNFDSALEARFIESLRRLGGCKNIPRTRLVQDIVNGKSGFQLEVDAQRYWIEPQVDISNMVALTYPSKPDFVIWPTQSNSPRKPIAIFCDGWAFHKDSVREDARKRSALVMTGKYWVWSVTHEDVKAALNGETETDLDSPLTFMTRHDLIREEIKPEPGAFSLHAVSRLLIWLGQVTDKLQDPYENRFLRNGAGLTIRMVPNPHDADILKVKAELDNFWQKLPEWMQNTSIRSVAAASKSDVNPLLMMRWPMSLANGKKTESCYGVLLLEDENQSNNEKDYWRAWRLWLHLFNTLQVMSGLLLTTRAGINGNDYTAILPATIQPTSINLQAGAQVQEWNNAIDSAMHDVQDGMKFLAQSGVDVPEVGFELVSQNGKIFAEAELAWPEYQIVVLLTSQEEYYPLWITEGWKAFLVSVEWVIEVRTLLEQKKGGE